MISCVTLHCENYDGQWLLIFFLAFPSWFLFCFAFFFFAFTFQHPLFKVPTLAPRKSLYFNVITHGYNKTLTVEGGGVNATVIQPDIAATNGIVHIIDRVLGVPFTTVGRKLATDPMLK